jgi:excisionase family DNA binding protein
MFMAGELDLHFLTVAEVAAIMRVSRMTVYRLVHSGELPAVRVGKSYRVPQKAVDDYLRGSYVDTERPGGFDTGLEPDTNAG